MKNKYLAVKERNEEIMNRTFEGTVFFAFSDKQFQEGMAKIVAKEPGELYRLGGSGGFYKKKDAEKIRAMYDTMAQNDKEAWEQGGEEYAYDAFSYELANHEFCITADIDDTLGALGISPQTIEERPEVYAGFARALAKYGSKPEYFGIERRTA